MYRSHQGIHYFICTTIALFVIGMHVFYEPSILSSSRLSLEESRHAINVLRLSIGDTVYVNDGSGHLYKTSIAESNPKKVLVGALEQVPIASLKRHIHIGIGITRHADRLEWFVEKATEIGVREISLLITQHTARHKVNIERLAKISISALKQSGNVYAPVISDPVSFKSFVSQYKAPLTSMFESETLKLICTATQERSLKSVVGGNENIISLIGPEGDFTDDELQMAITNNFLPVSLGPYRLRTETAALTIASALAVM